MLAPVREQLGAHLEPRALDLVGRHHGAHALPRALAVHPAALVHVAVQRDEAAVAVPLVGRPLALVRVAVGAHLAAVAIARVVCPVALVPGEGIAGVRDQALTGCGHAHTRGPTRIPAPPPPPPLPTPNPNPSALVARGLLVNTPAAAAQLVELACIGWGWESGAQWKGENSEQGHGQEQKQE